MACRPSINHYRITIMPHHHDTTSNCDTMSNYYGAVHPDMKPWSQVPRDDTDPSQRSQRSRWFAKGIGYYSTPALLSPSILDAACANMSI
jgi:hypothetical protein